MDGFEFPSLHSHFLMTSSFFTQSEIMFKILVFCVIAKIYLCILLLKLVVLLF